MSTFFNDIISRIYEAQATSILADELHRLKADESVSLHDFRATGTQDQLREAANKAKDLGLLSESRLAALLDKIEENGAQHVFLFDYSSGARSELTAERIAASFPEAPSPSPAMYVGRPSRPMLYYRVSSNPGAVVVKQVRSVEYWEKNDDESEEQGDRRIIVYNLHKKRAVNLFVVQPELGRAEIRIDRVRSQIDQRLVEGMFNDFRNDLDKRLPFYDLIMPTPIWNGFPRIIAAKSETFMTVDEASDSSVNVIMSSRREGSRGTDIRSHSSYDLDLPTYSRNQLNVYWQLPQPPGGPRRLLHTILTRVRLKNSTLAKVYFAARAAPEEIHHVLDRIRHFTP